MGGTNGRLEELDILVSNVNYSDGTGLKCRPAIVIMLAGKEIICYRITSQYETKSDYIKSKYFEIIDWIKAGLRKESWIDTVEFTGCTTFPKT